MNLMQRRRALMAMSGKRELFEANPPYWKLGSDVSTNGVAVQGACWYNNAVYFLTINSDNSSQWLYSRTIAGLATSLVGTFSNLGHANSMTCDQSNGVFYVATMDKTVGIKKISATDYSEIGNFTVLNPSGNPYTPWGIAFDNERNILYSRVGLTSFRIHNLDGTLVREVQLSTDLPDTVGQGLETDGTYLYFCNSNPNTISVYTTGGSYVTTITPGFTEEFEELIYDQNGSFHAAVFYTTGIQRFYSVLVRSFKNKLRVNYMLPGSTEKMEIGGTVGRSGYWNFQFKSTKNADFGIILMGQGYPFGYGYLKGKKCTFSCDIERVAGSSGQIGFNFFTANSQSVKKGSDRLYFQSVYIDIPATGSIHIEQSFVPGQSWIMSPTQDKEGTYVGFWIFLYASSGNQANVKNYKFEVESAE